MFSVLLIISVIMYISSCESSPKWAGSRLPRSDLPTLNGSANPEHAAAGFFSCTRLLPPGDNPSQPPVRPTRKHRRLACPKCRTLGKLHLPKQVWNTLRAFDTMYSLSRYSMSRDTAVRQPIRTERAKLPSSMYQANCGIGPGGVSQQNGQTRCLERHGLQLLRWWVWRVGSELPRGKKPGHLRRSGQAGNHAA